MYELLSGLLGVVVGWGLSEISARLRLKPKLCFHLVGTSPDELAEKEVRTKTSPSDYSIEVFNTGGSPFVLEQFSLCYNDKPLLDCILDSNKRVIQPYHQTVCILTEQDWDALLWHCRKERFKMCDISAVSVDDKQMKAKLDTSLVLLQLDMESDCGIIGGS